MSAPAIYAPPADRCYIHLSWKRCTRSHRRARVMLMQSEWYAPLGTCLSCGEEWIDGEPPLPRSSEPGWREKSIRAAWAFWGRWMRARQRKEISHEPQEKKS